MVKRTSDEIEADLREELEQMRRDREARESAGSTPTPAHENIDHPKPNRPERQL